MPDPNRQHPTCAHRPAASCERIVGRISDYERGVWTPKPFERVRIVTDDKLGTFVGTTGHVRVVSGGTLGHLVPTADRVRAVVILDELVVTAAADWMRSCEWNELAPAPPIGCECPACCSDEKCSSETCGACNCGDCPFVHACGCAEHGCGCPAGSCAGASDENGSLR